MKYITLIVFLTVILHAHCSLAAKNDTLILKNGDQIICEMKEMEKGVLTVKTDYSDKDFKIEWDGIQRIYSQTEFLITLSSNRRFFGNLKSIDDDSLLIFDFQNGDVPVGLNQIISLNQVKRTFSDRFSANIDFGYSFTREKNQQQLTVRSGIGYKAKNWSATIKYNTLNSTQDETSPIRSTDGAISYRQILPRNWYVPVTLTFLSNTSQKINLRINAKLGTGKYIIRSNIWYWGFEAGFSFNDENFDDENPDRQSFEGYFGTEIDIFDFENWALSFKGIVFPNFTELGRWRTDLNFDTKYDLPLDFYVKIGLSFNFDNRPVEGANDTNYVFSTGLGWEF